MACMLVKHDKPALDDNMDCADVQLGDAPMAAEYYSLWIFLVSTSSVELI